DRHDDVDLEGNQFCGKSGKSIEFLFRRTELEEKILAFDITGFAQSFAQLRPKGMESRASNREDSTPRYGRRLLRRGISSRYPSSSKTCAECPTILAICYSQ